jgi:hypothetical protein
MNVGFVMNSMTHRICVNSQIFRAGTKEHVIPLYSNGYIETIG